MTIKKLVLKSYKVLRQDGLFELMKKGKDYIRFHLEKEKTYSEADKTFMDVLFIKGCRLPHPVRYRVSHQIEQLQANGISANEVWYDQLSNDLVKNYRLFIFFRCPITDEIKSFIHNARKMNKKVFYDIDDLVIDTKYTDSIKFIQLMSTKDRMHYSQGVKLMGETLSMCDGAITTTERLAQELLHYVPNVFINRNTASSEMVQLSHIALRTYQEHSNSRNNAYEHEDDFVKIGYFSGSITHNDDFLLILPAIVRLMDEFPNLMLNIVGELDVPPELDRFKARIAASPFVSWRKLPSLIHSVDINIAPIEKSTFNEAKSENKWIEASLVKVPTVASNVGAFAKMIQHGNTGILCDNNVDDWYVGLRKLIIDSEYRTSLGERAYTEVIHNCVTVYTGLKFAEYIKSQLTPNIVFVFPSTLISGGILTALHHIQVLRQAGYDVSIINIGRDNNPIIFEGEEYGAVQKRTTTILGTIDKCVATLWNTTDFLVQYPNIKERYYLIQGFETDFYKFGDPLKLDANRTYNLFLPVHYLTISKWCEGWLLDKYNKKASYIPNGISLEHFVDMPRHFFDKIRILVEGNSEDFFKNVDMSFRIIEKLHADKYEVWYMSYLGIPKKWYRVDKFLNKVPYCQVPDVYQQCHILLKTSTLESFSYPPLEMMATGGYVVAVQNAGNAEYLENENNCMLISDGDIDAGVAAIERICSDKKLREQLHANGIRTVEQREWAQIRPAILKAYHSISIKERGYD